MKIEFRKVPTQEKNFELELNSVKIEGTFCKISPKLVKFNSKISGKLLIECSRCGKEHELDIDEKLSFLVSDGEYSSAESDELVIEVDNSRVDFDEIFNSELESIRSDYHQCLECQKQDDSFEREF